MTPLLTTLLLLTGCTTELPFGECTDPFPAHAGGESPYLHQQGSDIVDADGNVVVLHTINLGSWLHWEAWMFGQKIDLLELDRGSESHLLSRLTELYGADAAARFRTQLLDGFVTEGDFEQIAGAGFNSVRLPLNHRLFDEEGGWERVDQAIAWADAHGLRVILDMHGAPGGQSAHFTADPDDVLLWDSTDAQTELLADWATMAARYADEAAVAGYDLLNEPDPKDAADLLSLYDELIPIVRHQDPDHMLFVEGPALSREFRVFEHRLDENMAYSPHVYIWLGNSDAQWISALQTLSDCHDMPVWVGEFGEDGVNDIAGLADGFATLSGWAMWSWKKVDVGGPPGVSEIDAPEQWLTLMDSLTDRSGKAAVMDEAAAFAALDAFLVAAASPRVDDELLTALGL